MKFKFFLTTFFICFAAISSFGQMRATVTSVALKKVGSDTVKVNITIRIPPFVELHYPHINVIQKSNGRSIYKTGLTYYIHPGKRSNYQLKVPKKLLLNNDYFIVFSGDTNGLSIKNKYRLRKRKIKRATRHL